MQQRLNSSYFINLNVNLKNSLSDEDITHLCLYVLAALFGAISDRFMSCVAIGHMQYWYFT